MALHFPRETLPDRFLELKEAAAVRSLFERLGRGAWVQLANYERIEARMGTIHGARGMLRIARTHALFDLLTRIESWQLVGGKELGVRQESDRVRLKAVMRYLEQHFAEPVSRELLAGVIGMEPNSFSRFFHRASGQTFGDCLAALRVRHAATLLGIHRGLSVDSAMRQSGFRNQSVFNKQFRKRLGVSPRDYRQQLDREQPLP